MLQTRWVHLFETSLRRNKIRARAFSFASAKSTLLPRTCTCYWMPLVPSYEAPDAGPRLPCLPDRIVDQKQHMLCARSRLVLSSSDRDRPSVSPDRRSVLTRFLLASDFFVRRFSCGMCLCVITTTHIPSQRIWIPKLPSYRPSVRLVTVQTT
jgi:hypothetical protein